MISKFSFLRATPPQPPASRRRQTSQTAINWHGSTPILTVFPLSGVLGPKIPAPAEPNDPADLRLSILVTPSKRRVSLHLIISRPQGGARTSQFPHEISNANVRAMNPLNKPSSAPPPHYSRSPDAASVASNSASTMQKQPEQQLQQRQRFYSNAVENMSIASNFTTDTVWSPTLWPGVALVTGAGSGTFTASSTKNRYLCIN